MNVNYADNQQTPADFPLAGGYRSHRELGAMSIRELRRMSSQRGLWGGARMRKDRLVDALFEQQMPYVSPEQRAAGMNGANGSSTNGTATSGTATNGSTQAPEAAVTTEASTPES